MASAGEIKIKISAAVHKFQANMLAATRSMRKFEKMTRKANKKIIASFKTMTTGVGKALRKLKGAFIAAAAAGATVFGGARMVNNFTKIGREINNWSTSLGVSTTALQEFAAGGKAVGFGFEKTTDILKDVSDKIGDFVATGGGEARDIFERLGLHKFDLKGVSPDKALAKIVDQMERLGNVNQQEKVFLLEAIANDASKLLPLLSKGGEKFKQLREEARQTGAIISPQELKMLAKFESITRVIGMQWQGIKKIFVLSILPAVTQLASKIRKAFKSGDIKKFADLLANKVSEGIKTVANNMPSIVKGFTNFGKAAITVANALTTVVTKLKDIVTMKALSNMGAAITAEMNKLNLGKFSPKDRSATNLKALEKRMRDKAGPDDNPAQTSTGKWTTITDEFGNSITKLIPAGQTFAQSAKDFKASVDKWQKGQDKANEFLRRDSTGTYGAGVKNRDPNKAIQAQDTRFDKIANSIKDDARNIRESGGKIRAGEFDTRIAQLVAIKNRQRDAVQSSGGYYTERARFEGSSTKVREWVAAEFTKQTTSGMSDLINTLKNLGVAKPKEATPRVEMAIKLDKGLIADFIKQNPDAVKMIVNQQFAKETATAGK